MRAAAFVMQLNGMTCNVVLLGKLKEAQEAGGDRRRVYSGEVGHRQVGGL